MHNLRVSLGVLILAAMASCSKQEDDTGPGTGTLGGTGNTGVGSTGNNGTGANGTAANGTGADGSGANGTGASNTGSTGAGSNSSMGGSGSGASNTGGSTVEACTNVSGETKSGTAPPVIEFALDNTNSMSDDTQPSTKGLSKWKALQNAFMAAIPTLAASHPEYAIGLTYFHYKGYGPPGNPCTDALQAVEIAPLTQAQSNAVVANVNAERQIQMTPTQDIWQFAADHALAWNGGATYAQSNRYVVVLTDGVPTVGAGCTTAAGCTGSQGISDAQYAPFITAVSNYRDTKNLTTFMIAVPGAESLSQVTCNDDTIMYTPIEKEREVASAGGTDLIDLTTSATTDFTAALIDAITKQIGEGVTTVVGCNYAIPDPPPNPQTGGIQIVDKDAVEVWYFPNGGTSCASDSDCGTGHCSAANASNPNKCYTLVPRSDDCSDSNGWQYGDAEQTTINLCGGVCDTAQADPNAKVEVMIGCLMIG